MSGGACVVLPLTACLANRATPAVRGAEPEPSAGASPPGPIAPRGPSRAGNTAVPPAAAAPSLPVATDAAAARSAARTCERLVAKIGRNHGHEFPIAAGDVLEGATKDFDLRGSSDHTHAIALSSAELTALGRGEVVRKQSERGGVNAHRHRVLLRCEPQVLPPEMISACEIVVAGKDDHELVIPEADVRDGVERHYDIQGVAGHTHVLTVTPADFQRIASGENVDLKSGQGLGHFHHVYIRYPLS
jgi:hypothetical protein